MRVVILWRGISGYMASCWRALAQREGVELFVLAWGPTGNAPFDPEVMSGIPHRLLDEQERHDATLVERMVGEQQPDVVVICGWSDPPYVRLRRRWSSRPVRFAMNMDTPWLGTTKQYLNLYRLGRLVRSMDLVFVAGERAWQYARRFGVPERNIVRGCYGIDYHALTPAMEMRLSRPEGWPRRFLYAGRYVHDKAIDVLVEGYRRYRARASDPWPLDCCGSGPLASALRGVEGISDLGFVQPRDQPRLFSEHGAFVLASRFDPWPLVLVEASAAGLPAVCSEACGSAVELQRSNETGFRVATGDPDALAEGLRRCAARIDDLPEMGRRLQVAAANYSADAWARHWHEELRRVTGS